jgi:hypothetical protein
MNCPDSFWPWFLRPFAEIAAGLVIALAFGIVWALVAWRQGRKGRR